MFTKEEDQAARVLVVPAGETRDRIAARIAAQLPAIKFLAGLAPLDEANRAVEESDMLIIVSGLENAGAAERAAQYGSLARKSASCQVSLTLVAKSSVSRSGPAMESVEALDRSVDAFSQVSGDSLSALDESALS